MAIKIDPQTFLSWAKQHFTEIKAKNRKIRLNSIYCEDDKQHLWCRPYTGFFHCYKSGKMGSLYDLVMDVEKCSYSEAVDILGGEQSLRCLEEKLEAFLNPVNPKKEVVKKKLSLPENTIPINKLIDPYKEKVMSYLNSRKLPSDGLYYCVGGEFAGRIVIPYYNSDGDLIYFNARDINPKSYLRYRGPEVESGFKKEESVWMSFFPKKGAKIYLTEGEFDAMTLNLCGLHGCATGGKDVGTKQIALISHYDICLSFDRDPSGKKAFCELGWTMYEYGVKKVTFIRPPEPYKDWNEMLVKGVDKKVIRAYITRNEKPFNEFTAALLEY